jgi:glutathione S-transferase
MRYELYYWSSIQGRGEFVRLALEEAAAEYVDVARGPEKKGAGVPALLRLLDGETIERPPFAPPFLKAGRLIIGQTANILMYIGARHGLAPASEAGRLWAHQLQLTLADFARRRSADFLKSRAPNFLGYFERVLARNPAGDGHLVGARLTYPDLSLFQVVSGLRYAFPNAMARLEKKLSRIVALHDRVAARPRIAAYLTSDRRIPFSEEGIFRHYKELDAKA